MIEKFFIYYNGIAHFDFTLFTSQTEAISKAQETINEGKVSTVYVGKLVKVARRDVVLSDDQFQVNADLKKQNNSEYQLEYRKEYQL